MGQKPAQESSLSPPPARAAMGQAAGRAWSHPEHPRRLPSSCPAAQGTESSADKPLCCQCISHRSRQQSSCACQHQAGAALRQGALPTECGHRPACARSCSSSAARASSVLLGVPSGRARGDNRLELGSVLVPSLQEGHRGAAPVPALWWPFRLCSHCSNSFCRAPAVPLATSSLLGPGLGWSSSPVGPAAH